MFILKSRYDAIKEELAELRENYNSVQIKYVETLEMVKELLIAESEYLKEIEQNRLILEENAKLKTDNNALRARMGNPASKFYETKVSNIPVPDSISEKDLIDDMLSTEYPAEYQEEPIITREETDKIITDLQEKLDGMTKYELCKFFTEKHGGLLRSFEIDEYIPLLDCTYSEALIIASSGVDPEKLIATTEENNLGELFKSIDQACAEIKDIKHDNNQVSTMDIKGVALEVSEDGVTINGTLFEKATLADIYPTTTTTHEEAAIHMNNIKKRLKHPATIFGLGGSTDDTTRL